MSCLYKGKNFYCPSLVPSPYNAFLYFSEGQVHRDRKLGIMTNVGKNGLVKVISTNIHKISDACANGFGCIMTVQCMRNVFTLLNSSFSGKMVFLRKLKLIYLSTPSVTKIVQSLPFAFYWKNLLAPPPIYKRGQRLCILYEGLQRRDNKVITILHDRFLIYSHIVNS